MASVGAHANPCAVSSPDSRGTSAAISGKYVFVLGRILCAVGLLIGAPACTAAHRISRANDAREEASSRSWRGRHAGEQVGGGVVRDSQVPRVYCYDGSLSLTCTSER
ncbi:MAG TPA: hypothetical protein VMF89_09280, partial [Polyangiales bacterium]|nr:hypothetical protein [Polyangiales bacterium]